MKSFICVLFAGLTVGAHAYAAPVSYRFEASFSGEVVENVDNAPAASLFERARGLSSITGVITYDDNVGAGDVLRNQIRFSSPVSFRLDQLDLTVAENRGLIRVSDASGSPADFFPDDQIFFQAGMPGAPTAPGEFYPGLVSLRLNDSTDSVFSDLTLPDELMLSDFDSAFLAVGVLAFNVDDDLRRDRFGSAFVVFSVDSFERLPVPLPGALPLFLAGAAGMGAALRKRRR